MWVPSDLSGAAIQWVIAIHRDLVRSAVDSGEAS